MNDSVYVIGNGLSRKNINPSQLKGTIIGCNACYRDFKPDIICATDAGIISDIIDSGFDGDCYFTHDSWNLLPASAKPSLSNGTEHETKRKKGDDQFVFISGLDSGVKQPENYIIWVPKKMEHKIKNIGSKVLGWSTGTSAAYVACKEWMRPCRPDGTMNGPKKVYLLGFDHKNAEYDNLYADTKHYYSRNNKQEWKTIHRKWSDQLYRIFEWFPNIEFYWVNGGHETKDSQFQKNLYFLDEKEI